jgi:signal peptidase I
MQGFIPARGRQDEDPSIRPRPLWRRLFDLVVLLTSTLALALLTNVFIVEAAWIKEGPSMQPNLYRGYRVVMEKVSYHLHPPRRGDVVIVNLPDEDKTLIKRVIGLPGETIEVRDGHVLIDGSALEEPWVAYYGGRDYPPGLVPEDHVFVLGDNRPVSRDSRAIGPVPLARVEGRVRIVFWPLDKARVLD